MESNNFLTKILLMGETNMDNIEEELNKLQPVKQDEEENSDASLFSGMKKKKKRDKLFSEVTSILEDSGDDDMLSAFHFKSKKKNQLDKTDDIFDTSGKESKKTKNLEAKFKTELTNLQKLLKDNENTSKIIQSVLDPILNSKARGSAKMMSDLIMALNSSNNNRLATIKEISALKKGIIDLKIKMDKDRKDNDEGMSSEQFGSLFFDKLFKYGRANVINSANEYNQDVGDFVSSTNGKSFEEICDERLSNESNSYRSDDGNKMIQYESLQPEIVIFKDHFGNCTVKAIDHEGNEITDYPVPTLDQLGKLIFDTYSGTCTDRSGRVFKVIET